MPPPRDVDESGLLFQSTSASNDPRFQSVSAFSKPIEFLDSAVGTSLDVCVRSNLVPRCSFELRELRARSRGRARLRARFVWSCVGNVRTNTWGSLYW